MLLACDHDFTLTWCAARRLRSVTGPNVGKMVTHEDVTTGELGGAETARRSRVEGHATVKERACWSAFRTFGTRSVSKLPNNVDAPPRGA